MSWAPDTQSRVARGGVAQGRPLAPRIPKRPRREALESQQIERAPLGNATREQWNIGDARDLVELIVLHMHI